MDDADAHLDPDGTVRHVSRPPSPLPPPLDGAAFSVQAAMTAGVSRQRLRHSSLDAPTRGLRVADTAATLPAQAAALAWVLPVPWAFSHETAAELLGLPLPRNWRTGRALHVLRPTDCSPVRRPGIEGHRGLETRRLLVVNGLPVTELVDTWCDLATRLAADDLVVAGDALLLRGPTVEDVAALVATRRGFRGAALLAAAVPLLRYGSGSPMETRARLAFMRGGLPEPLLSADIHDHAGGWVASADFVWPQARLVVEYEGDVHRVGRQQWLTDVARMQVLEDLGWRVLRITARDLSTPQLIEMMVERIRRALDARLR